VSEAADLAGLPAQGMSGGWSMIVLDAGPDNEAFELCRRLRAQPGGDEPVVLVVLEEGAKGQRDAAIEEGATDYLHQPLEAPGLATRLLAAERIVDERDRRRRSEEALRESERFLGGILDSIQEGISVLDTERRILRVNPVMERWYAHAMPLIGKKCYEAYHHRDGPCDVCATKRVLDDGAPGHEEVPRRGPTGEVVGWLDLFSFPLIDRTTGKLAGVVEFVRDITQRKAAEAALRRSEENFRSVIERIPDMIAVAREDRTVWVNPVAVAMLGYDRLEKVIGVSAIDMFHPDDRALVRARAGLAAAGGKPPLTEMRLVRRDGTFLAVEGTFLQVSFDGRPALMGVARDITERRQVQAQLMLADRLSSMGRLAAVVAHEVNNPLAYVVANLDQLAGRLEALAVELRDERIAELGTIARDTHEGTQRVHGIVRDLKSFSRAEAAEAQVVDVRRVVGTAARMVRNELRHRARLVEELGDVPPVLADEARLVQVFLNLLVNAAEALPKGGDGRHEVGVRTTTSRDGRVVVEVWDTGVGIPPERLGRIFDPFYTTKPIGVGTGLGLAIVHTIVTGLEGRIEVESVPGKGSLFRVMLPPAAPALAAERPAPKPSEAPERRRLRVLIVDDEPRLVASLRRWLAAGHDVEATTSARDALERFVGGKRYDAILCDLMMPEMTGMELHARLVRQAPDQAARMVFVTGGAFTVEAQEFLARVSNARLEKPFALEELLGTIRRAAKPTA
jgi:two-component system cell cycle sensor histidine kinase/response regulator CckA